MTQKFMTSSIFLFLDLIVVAASGWLYWLVISKLISISEIGQSTAVYSLIALTGTIVGLGLEYPLLKKTSSEGSKIVGSGILIEIIVTIAAIPFVLVVLGNVNYNATVSLSVVSIMMLISISLGFITRYALLGISASRTILIIDTVSTAVKFVTGYTLVISGFGVLGVLISFMLQALITLLISMTLVTKSIGFSFGDLKFIKNTVIDGIVNMPSIFSRTIIFSLSVVLLASFGVSSSEIGVFYIALMISVVAGGLISSTAYMVIPASSKAQEDLSVASIRMGISLTAPVISLLLASPQLVLSLIGPEYISGHVLLLILALGILPYAIVTNTISRLNYLGKSRKILFVGLLQILGFIVGFVLLVPLFNDLGAAMAILISYSISCIPAIIWSERILLRYIANVIIALISGWGVSSLLRLFIVQGAFSEIMIILTSISITLVLIFVLKNTTITEVRTLVKTIVKG